MTLRFVIVASCCLCFSAQAQTHLLSHPPGANSITLVQAQTRQAPLPDRHNATIQDVGETAQTAQTVSPDAAAEITEVKDIELRYIARRLIIVTFEGRLPSDTGTQSVRQALKSGQVVGVFIRSENIENTPQLHELASSFSGPDNGPVMVIMDSSGGMERAFAQAKGLESPLTPLEMAEAGDALGAFHLYQDMAAELAALGITMILGPSADICSQHTRQTADCFGSAPSSVAAFTAVYALAHEENRVLTAMRYTLSTESQPGTETLREMLRQKAPDALIIGLEKSSAPDFDIIARFIGSVREAGFAGAVILDRSAVPAKEAALTEALQAGADMIIASSGRDSTAYATTLAVEGLRQAINLGRLERSRLTEASRRADVLNARLKAWAPNAVTQSGGVSTIGVAIPR